ncbi:insulinase family protein [Nocardioides zeae]|uniref:Insulinase family protein n=1 Tax=Nocardioides imazamoxiresistens TaxID=3231893 RepID=A0ABU3PVA9_9ACTN|nr:insulinase family protein [Nocardioides zeae]MDT9593114.1 insulinase family protein [Nocardioides zeae]
MRIPDHHARRTSAASGSVDVVAVDWPGAPFAELRLVLPSRRTDARTTALAHLTGRLLALHPDDADAGAATERMLRAGGRLGTTPLVDRVTVAATVPADGVVATVADVVDRVRRRTWRPEAVAGLLRAELTLQQQVAGYREVDVQAAVARRRWGAEHPYAHGVLRPAMLADLAVDDLVEDLAGPAAEQAVTLHGATVLVVGDLGAAGTDPADLAARLVAVLEQAPPPRPLPPLPAARPDPGHERLPASPGATGLLRVVTPAPVRQDPDHPAALAAGMVLGGYFGSRLNRELRERRGYVYGVSCGFEVLADAASLVLSLDCTDDRMDGVRSEVHATLDDLVTHGPTPAELAAATAYSTNAATVGISSPAALASAGSAVVLGGDDLGMWERHAARARALTSADVAAVAARHLRAEVRVEVVSPTSDGDR